MKKLYLELPSYCGAAGIAHHAIPERGQVRSGDDGVMGVALETP
jgi:hypothetical protein